MKNSNAYTHGGSAGKNMALLLRSLMNLAAFAALWIGIPLFAQTLGKILTIGGGAALLLCLWGNLISPMCHRVR